MRRVLVLALGLAAAGTSPVAAHSFYTGLRSPTGIPCCDSRDCRPVDLRETGHGDEIFANGDWYPVEQAKVLPTSSPDGQAHACWGNQIGKPAFLCIILPGYADAEPDPGPAFAALEDETAGICRGRP